MTTATSPTRPRQPAPRLAYAPTPLEDEPLDGYLEHVAYCMGVEPRTLHRHLGLSGTTAYGILRQLSPEDADPLTAATEIAAQRLRDMTLARYAPIGLMPPPDKRGHGTGAWARGSGARYCPECLRERGWRWRLSWYLQWSYACPRHGRLLRTRCPACARPVRTRSQGHPITRWTPGPGTDTDVASCTCATNLLTDHPAVALEVAPPAVGLAPLLRAQRMISDVIHHDAEAPRAFGASRSRVEWLLDLAALTRLLITHLPADHIPAGYLDILSRPGPTATVSRIVGGAPPAARVPRQSDHGIEATSPERAALGALMERWGAELDLKPLASPASRLSEATFSPVAIAVTASAAACILASPSTATAGDLLEVLPAAARRSAVSKSAQRRLSWPLVQALDDQSGRVRPARARTIRFGVTRLRLDGTERHPLDPAKVPARLWQEVVDHHSLARADGYTYFAASVALLSIATHRNIAQVCTRLGHPHLAGRIGLDVATVLGLAVEGDSQLFDELVRLHDVLSLATVPIDYARRRRTFPHPVPPATRTARRIARELGLRPTMRLTRFMGWWVYELLTGSDILLNPSRLDLHASHRLAYARQRREWNAAPPVPLLRRAERALLVNCLDEPLTWSPQRTSGDGWRCPPAETVRLLTGWANRRSRGSSRLTDSAMEGLELNEAVAFAASAQSQTSARLAVKMARFAVIVEVGTITQAASNIGLRQSTLTDSITALERELGITLLNRGTHAFTITESGRHLYRLVIAGPLRHTDPSRRLNPAAKSDERRDES